LRSFGSALIPTLWLGWLAYWWIAGLHTHEVRQRESVSSRLSHALPLLAGVVLFASPPLAPSWLSERALPRTLSTYWIGVAVLLAGLAFSIWARRHLAGWWSSVVTLKQDHQLIRSGPYRWTRHPIYGGLLMGLLGTAIAQGEWRGFLAMLVIAIAFLRKIAVEERFLRHAFPEAYERYRAEVPALIPFVY